MISGSPFVGEITNLSPNGKRLKRTISKPHTSAYPLC